jgi:hypothetical protein
VIVIAERYLRRTVAEFVAHYHAERNHQGLGNELIQPLTRPDRSDPTALAIGHQVEGITGGLEAK